MRRNALYKSRVAQSRMRRKEVDERGAIGEALIDLNLIVRKQASYEGVQPGFQLFDPVSGSARPERIPDRRKGEGEARICFEV